MDTTLIISLVISALMLGYLFFVMIYPEMF